MGGLIIGYGADIRDRATAYRATDEAAETLRAGAGQIRARRERVDTEEAEVDGVEPHGPDLDEDAGLGDGTGRGAVVGEAEARGLVVRRGSEAPDNFNGGHGGLGKTRAREVGGIAAERGAEAL
jgi:hypothetical protein